MPWWIPLDGFLRYDHCPQAVESLGVQFLEGVAFMHEHKVSHLDLKPNNLVVTSSTRWLPITDFGISVFVEGEETEVNGYRGTPSWVAPEVRSEDGPRRSYSAILADR
ncbi:kinase-like domain-containing protein [Multifurca ochricompacta]|uniref:Kinase-like domain-containing protein n=1 Tax=Multifurca ochricompacta TaxID=376703 RepID=A0AAD4M1J1_9AGAM|nr:kinase-like domain-containing protein [Multifurca ochricompacta]